MLKNSSKRRRVVKWSDKHDELVALLAQFPPVSDENGERGIRGTDRLELEARVAVLQNRIDEAVGG